MRIRHLAFAVAGVALATTGCNQSVTLYQPTLPPEAIVTEVLTGTVALPVGVGAGTVTAGGICIVAATAYVATIPGAGPHLSGSLPQGTYCIQVSDVTGQVGPVAFSITVTHP